MIGDLFHVGTAVNAQGEAAVTRRHEELNERLLAIPEEVTATALDARLVRATSIMLWSLQLPTIIPKVPTAKGLAVQRFITTAIGKEQLEIHQGSRQRNAWGVGWQSIAQQALAEHRAESRMLSAMAESTSFSKDNRTLMLALSRVALSNLTPYGTYSRYAFAAGMGSGDIKIPESILDYPTPDQEPNDL